MHRLHPGAPKASFLIHFYIIAHDRMGRKRTKSAASAPAHTPSVAVIGGGLGGLTAAYKLSLQGFKVTLFEGAKNLGGRVKTDINSFSPQGQFCEKGGEWIDSTHHDIRTLAHELKLDIQDISKQRAGDELFYFGGKCYGPNDFMTLKPGEDTQSGAFVPWPAILAATAGAHETTPLTSANSML